MTNPSTIPRSLALNTFYGAHSRFAVQSQGDICHLSRAARAVQPLLVPLPEHEQCGCRPQPEHEPRDGRSDDGTYISQFRKAPGGGAGFHRPPRRARGTLTRRTDPGRGQGCLHGPRTFTSPHLTVNTGRRTSGRCSSTCHTHPTTSDRRDTGATGPGRHDLPDLHPHLKSTHPQTRPAHQGVQSLMSWLLGSLFRTLNSLKVKAWIRG
jgi:hypothetical protein